VGDLKVGDQVRFRQTRNDDGSYTVTALAVVVPTIHGTASDITSSGFKVTTRDGSVWTVTVNGQTTYGYGQGTGSRSDVKAGEAVRVAGTITADNQMTATSVRVAGDRVVGQVTAKTADSITINKRDGSSVTIHVDADTTYRVAGVENADLGDVAVDMAIGGLAHAGEGDLLVRDEPGLRVGLVVALADVDLDPPVLGRGHAPPPPVDPPPVRGRAPTRRCVMRPARSAPGPVTSSTHPLGGDRQGRRSRGALLRTYRRRVVCTGTVRTRVGCDPPGARGPCPQ